MRNTFFLSSFLIAIFLVAPQSFAEVKVKIDPSGKKVFYNTPSPFAGRTESGTRTVPLSYSQRYENYSTMIHQVSANHGVDADLVKAVIQVESNYNSRAVSHCGAMGLMQLMPATAARFGVDEAFDPWENVNGGVRYLKFLLTYFDGNLEYAVAAYNAGENAVRRFKGIPRYKETQDYVRKVLALYNGDTSYTVASQTWSPAVRPTYYKFVDEKGVTHYTTESLKSAGLTKVKL